MFDIGWTELLLIGIVTLIVVGPKDLPVMFRTLGRFTAKARNMAREFQRAMHDAADQAGMQDTVKDLKDIANPRKLGLDKLEEAAESFEKWEPRRPGKGAPAADATGAGAAKADKSGAAKADRPRTRSEAETAGAGAPAADPAPASAAASRDKNDA